MSEASFQSKAMLEESVTSVPSIWASMNSWFTPTVLFLFLNLMIGTIYVTSSLATQKHGGDHHDHLQDDKHHHHHIPRSPSVLQRLKSINFYNYRSPEPTTVTYEKPPQFDSHFTLQQSSPENYHQNQSFLSRSPSILQRLKSVNLYNYFSQEPINSASQKTRETAQTYFAPLSALYQQEEVEENVAETQEGEEVEGKEETIDEIYSKLQSNNKVNRSMSDTKPASGEVPTKLPTKMRKSASTKSAFAHFEEDEIVEARRPATVREGKSKMTEVGDAEVDAKADDFINRFKQQLKLQRIDSIMRYKEMIHSGSGN